MHSIFIAQLLGFYFVIFALAMFLRRDTMKVSMLDIAKSHGQIMTSGAAALFVGLAIAICHNVWTGQFVFITVLAYFFIFQGLMRVFFTEWVKKTATKVLSRSGVYYIAGAIWLVVGLVLLTLSVS